MFEKMFVSLDFGGSTLDMALWRCKGDLIGVESFEIAGGDLSQVEFDWGQVERIVVTGGKSRWFDDEFDGRVVVKVDEIDAIGRGGMFLLGDEDVKRVLVVSMGTGTCMVEVDNGICRHIGGTGIGGGTFLGLMKELCGEKDIEKLKQMFQKGELSKVDLSVGDIVGGGIGIVSEEATASNLGKLVREIDFSKSDLASGIVNLIGQSIGTTVVFAAKAHGCELVVLTGKLARIEKILEIIRKVGDFYGVRMVVPDRAAYVAAIGAGVV